MTHRGTLRGCQGRLIWNYNGRLLWQTVVANNCMVWAVYNNGRNLYYDPYNLPALTYYVAPWNHIPFCIYSVAGQSQFGLCPLMSYNQQQNLMLTTLGHDGNCNAIVMLNNDAEQIHIIPPLNILYLAVDKQNKVAGSLLQPQPLPSRITPLMGRLA